MATRFSDCELRDDWFLEQDVNAWTALSYVVAAAVLLVIVVQGRLPRTFGLLSALLALEGVGSVLYHGNRGDLARFLHDVPLVGVLGFAAGWHAGRLANAAARGAWLGALGGVAGASAAWVLAPDAVRVAAACCVLFIGIAELVARRRGVAPQWTMPLVLLVAGAGAAWLAGTPDSPLCDERSWFQPHGLWHVLTALAFVRWAMAAPETRMPQARPSVH